MAIKTRQTTADGVTNKGAPLTNDELDNNFVELTQGKVDASGDTMTGDLNFGDNDKAVFGAGSDLQIYHDASGQSYIREVGTGGLNIEGTNMTFRDQTGTELYATFTANGQVVLYYDNSAKLATTSTGVDVTGTVTADGLTASTSGNQVMLLDSTAGGATLQMRTASGSLSNYLRSGLGGSANLRFETTGNVVRQKIDENGDISFYDSTGVSQSFYWDASAESLGIGTTTPDGIFESTGGRSYLRGSDENYTLGIGRGGNTGNYFLGATASSSPDLLFSNNAGTTNVVFTNGGNVGIGTNSPDAALSVIGTTQSGTGANNNTLGSAISLSGLGASQPLMAMRWTGLSHSGISGSNYTSQIVIDSANSNVTELYNTGATPLVFGTNATERMRIDSSGNVGIGTSSPTGKLQASVASNTSFMVGSAVGLSDGVTLNSITDANSANLGMELRATTFAVSTRAGGLESMRIDSSGNVGIGTSSPSQKLTVYEPHPSTAGASLRLESGNLTQGPNSVIGTIDFYSNDADGAHVSSYIKGLASETYGRTGQLAFGVSQGLTDDATEAMRIDSSGNVGVGTSSPANDSGYAGLTLSGSTGSQIVLQDDGTTEGLIWNNNALNIEAKSTNPTVFRNNGSEAMRIDSSGNLLVGKTVADTTTSGGRIRPSGRIDLAVSNDKTISANRLGSDGSIIDFYKNGSPVGSIGNNTTRLYIGSGDTNLTFNDVGGVQYIFPTAANRTAEDSTINLGTSGARFKNLYLSGGVYLGGTGSANKLDDYEEGTWVPTTDGDPTGVITGANGAYVKIGNLVHIQCQFQVTTSFTNFSISGLPFTPRIVPTLSNQYGLSPVSCNVSGSFVQALIVDTANDIIFRVTDANTGHSPSTTGNAYRFCMTYETTA